MDDIDTLLGDARDMETGDENNEPWHDTKTRNKRRNIQTKNNVGPLPAPIIANITPRPDQIRFGRAIKSFFPSLKIKFTKELRNPNEILIQPEDENTRLKLMKLETLKTAFPDAAVQVRKPLNKQKPKPSFVIVNVQHSIKEEDIKNELQLNNRINATAVKRVVSRASGQPTKLIRVFTESDIQAIAAQKHGIQLGL